MCFFFGNFTFDFHSSCCMTNICVVFKRILNYSLYADYIVMYKKYMNNDFKMRGSCARFAKRSIVFRLALNQLENDKFFSCIQVQQKNNHDIDNDMNNEKDETKEYVTENVGYARKILTIKSHCQTLHIIRNYGQRENNA